MIIYYLLVIWQLFSRRLLIAATSEERYPHRYAIVNRLYSVA